MLVAGKDRSVSRSVHLCARGAFLGFMVQMACRAASNYININYLLMTSVVHLSIPVSLSLSLSPPTALHSG
ncbi:hypothetical protein KIPB_014369 [Kipferlia bialata]|uniref:Uncharacterized protein n=1 Tax=Kipferlia bialata TaxID=797122 RepID=A0A9K3D9R0_9EUKA|nr:hypothetical protein KIPB_014369 [Kipferlia bialata]|eukprot:g14369.t1